MTKKNKIINVILYFWLITLLVYRIIICFSYKNELTNGETNNIWKAINVTNGDAIYNNPEELPLDVFQYTPISEFPIILFAKILNPDSKDYVYWITVLGRFYQLACNIILAYFIYKIAKKNLFLSKTESVFTMLISISLLTTTAFTIRPDSTVLLCMFVLVYKYGKAFLDGFNNKSILLISILIILNFYCKQDGIFIAFPIGLHLILNKKWKVFFKISSYSIILLSLSFLLIYIINGNYFFINTILGLKNTTSINQMISVFDRAYSFYGLIICTGIVLNIKYSINTFNPNINFLGILGVFYFLIALSISTKIGSWVNYYTPFIIISSITGMYYFNNKINEEKNYTIHSIYLTVISFFLFKQIYNYTLPYLKYNANKQYYDAKYNDFKIIKKNLNILKSEKIIIPNHLLRLFFAENTVLVNIEYYNQASYSYKNFKKKKNKKIKYIIYNKSEKSTIDFLISHFNIDTEKYKVKNLNDFYILEQLKP